MSDQYFTFDRDIVTIRMRCRPVGWTRSTCKHTAYELISDPDTYPDLEYKCLHCRKKIKLDDLGR